MRRAWFVVVGRPCIGVVVNQQATSHLQSTTRGLFAPGSAARVVWNCPRRPGGGFGGQLPALRGLPPGGGQRSCRPATRRVLASHPFLSPGPPREGRVSGPCPVCSIPCARVHRAEGTRFPDEILPHRFLQPHYTSKGLHSRLQFSWSHAKNVKNDENFHVYCSQSSSPNILTAFSPKSTFPIGEG